MKITRRQLRNLILEQLTLTPEEDVMRRLRDMFVPGKGLPVTHEFPARSLDEVLEEEAILGSYGIFFTIGHLQEPQFVIDSGYMVHGYISPGDVHSRRGAVVRPDMRFFSEVGEEYDDEWEAMLAEQRGDLVGLEISTSYDEWPSSNWEKIVNNDNGEIVWPAVNL